VACHLLRPPFPSAREWARRPSALAVGSALHLPHGAVMRLKNGLANLRIRRTGRSCTLAVSLLVVANNPWLLCIVCCVLSIGNCLLSIVYCLLYIVYLLVPQSLQLLFQSPCWHWPVSQSLHLLLSRPCSYFGLRIMRWTCSPARTTAKPRAVLGAASTAASVFVLPRGWCKLCT
jgi:hypothetical protein